MTARVFLHEMDHLDGIAHTSRANTYHLEQARKLVKKLKNKSLGGLPVISAAAQEFIDALQS
jgi:hypothetical protein